MQLVNDLWAVTGDATQLHQVILNLVVNARDAMPGAYLCTSVIDSGHGIAPDDLERIFEPFFTTRDVGKGTGLRLSTAHAIVQSHRGFISVYSESGKGSTFKVYLHADPKLRPAARRHPPHSRADSAKPPP